MMINLFFIAIILFDKWFFALYISSLNKSNGDEEFDYGNFSSENFRFKNEIMKN